MAMKDHLWSLGLLGNDCPDCGSDMIQKGHNKAYTKYICENPECPGKTKVERYYDVRGWLHMRMFREPFIYHGYEEMECIYCGCTDDMTCPGGCGWIVPWVCSSCEDLFYGTETITMGFIDFIPDDAKLDQIRFLAENIKKDIAIGFRGEKLILYSVTITPGGAS